ncbi:Alpha crystallin/Hsp20 domain [Macleaya cordata]|uniref:Alpha crystallin/Hsp20 domain n=1 Tax=Macleaya cordata TaxID=56857 RepID=A0A200PY44_MACCD|nr:Alpha crystallin/Hsp20 domain [Macleaya cordata]
MRDSDDDEHGMDNIDDRRSSSCSVSRPCHHDLSPNRCKGAQKVVWDAREDEEAMYLKVEMPGLVKDHVKVSVKETTLTIEGREEKEEYDDEDTPRRYLGSLSMPPNFIKIDQIKVEVKNGVIRVSLPKVKKEKKKDVFQVKLECDEKE